MRQWKRQVCVIALLLGLRPHDWAHAAEVEWRKVFELPTAGAAFRTVWADAGGWVAAGAQIIAMNRNGRVESTPEPERTILSIASTNDGLFALGFEQLILRLDKNRWVEEHYSALPPTAGRRQRVAGLLYGARVFETGKGTMTGAYGPWRVLLRWADHTWADPSESERSRLDSFALLGPESPRPARCARSEWLWLDDHEGWFACQDGRSFRTGSTTTIPTGDIPGVCQGVADDVASVGTKVYLLCQRKLWESSSERWDRVSGLKDILAIAGNTRCLFAVTLRSVWERCTEPPSGSTDASKTRK